MLMHRAATPAAQMPTFVVLLLVRTRNLVQVELAHGLRLTDWEPLGNHIYCRLRRLQQRQARLQRLQQRRISCPPEIGPMAPSPIQGGVQMTDAERTKMPGARLLAF